MGTPAPGFASRSSLDAASVSATAGEGVAKTRIATNVGTTAKEVKWGIGDSITEVVLSCEYAGGKTSTTGNYALVCFDTTALTAASLIGADGAVTPIESLSSDIDVHKVHPGESLHLVFTEALSYSLAAGYLGNAFVKTVNATATLDVFLTGVDKS